MNMLDYMTMLNFDHKNLMLELKLCSNLFQIFKKKFKLELNTQTNLSLLN